MASSASVSVYFFLSYFGLADCGRLPGTSSSHLRPFNHVDACGTNVSQSLPLCFCQMPFWMQSARTIWSIVLAFGFSFVNAFSAAARATLRG